MQSLDNDSGGGKRHDNIPETLNKQNAKKKQRNLIESEFCNELRLLQN